MADNILLERIAIAAALKDYKVYQENLSFYTAENFQTPLHKQILKYLIKYNDLILLDIDLHASLEYKKAGGIQHLQELKAIEINPEDVKKYLIKLIEKKTLNELQQKYAQIQLAIMEERPFDDIVDLHKEISVFELNQGIEAERDIEQVAHDVINKSYYNFVNNLSITGLRTYIDKIDNITAGLQPSNLIVLAGKEGSAKTSLVTTIADNVSIRPITENRKRTVFFSAEMSEEDLTTRLYCGYIKNTFTKVLTGKLDKKEWLRYKYALEKMKSAPIEIYDKSAPDPIYMRSKLSALKNKGKQADLVIFDYLQIGGSNKKHGSRADEVAYIARSMKEIAKDYKVPVIALCQLNRDNDKNTDRRPQLHHLRESSEIAAASDLVLGLYREEYFTGNNPGIAELLILKGRNLAQGTIYLSFIKEHMRFENLLY